VNTLNDPRSCCQLPTAEAAANFAEKKVFIAFI